MVNIIARLAILAQAASLATAILPPPAASNGAASIKESSVHHKCAVNAIKPSWHHMMTELPKHDLPAVKTAAHAHTTATPSPKSAHVVKRVASESTSAQAETSSHARLPTTSAEVRDQSSTSSDKPSAAQPTTANLSGTTSKSGTEIPDATGRPMNKVMDNRAGRAIGSTGLLQEWGAAVVVGSDLHRLICRGGPGIVMVALWVVAAAFVLLA